MAAGKNCCFSDMSKKRGFIQEVSLSPYKTHGEIGFTSSRNYSYFKSDIKNWLGDEYVQKAKNNRLVIKIEPRDVQYNPYLLIYKMYITNKLNIYCYFMILNALNKKDKNGAFVRLSYNEIFEGLTCVRPHKKLDGVCCDNTFKAKVNELYQKYGILQRYGTGRNFRFCCTETKLSLDRWKDAIDFFCEYDGMGVIGSFILDRIERGDYSSDALPQPKQESCFSFKHHYVYQVIESDIVEQLIYARKKHCTVEVEIKSKTSQRYTAKFVPMKFYFNAKNGRRYILGITKNDNDIKLNMYRIDRIISVKMKHTVKEFNDWLPRIAEYEKNMWGVSIPHYPVLDHIEMTIVVPDEDSFVLKRLEREKKCGQVECIHKENHQYRYSADVHDANELLPWIRSFTGYIVDLTCSSKDVTDKFYRDFNDFAALYGE